MFRFQPESGHDDHLAEGVSHYSPSHNTLLGMRPEAHVAYVHVNGTTLYFGDLQMPAYQVSPADLVQINRPCLVLSGTESLPTMQNIARTLAEGIPGAKYVRLEGTGHVTPFERPAEFAAAVAALSDSLRGAKD